MVRTIKVSVLFDRPSEIANQTVCQMKPHEDLTLSFTSVGFGEYEISVRSLTGIYIGKITKNTIKFLTEKYGNLQFQSAKYHQMMMFGCQIIIEF